VTTAPPEEPNRGKTSRLEQELDEILNRAHADDLKPPPRPKRTPNLRSIAGGKSSKPGWQFNRSQSGAFWMIGALVIAFLAVLVSDASPLLARLLVFAAIISFLVPIISRYRRKSGPPEQKMWRGRTVEVTPPQTSPIDQVREWWHNRTRR
jgi:hypothetical protein